MRVARKQNPLKINADTALRIGKNLFTRSVKMKNKYEHAKIELILLDDCDIITTSDVEDEGPIVDAGPIGGGGYDEGGWT